MSCNGQLGRVWGREIERMAWVKAGVGAAKEIVRKCRDEGKKEKIGCGLKGKRWPCLGREDGEAARKNGLSDRFLRKKVKAGWGRRL